MDVKEYKEITQRQCKNWNMNDNFSYVFIATHILQYGMVSPEYQYLAICYYNLQTPSQPKQAASAWKYHSNCEAVVLLCRS